VLIGALDVSAGPEIVSLPLLLVGLGVGALASQLGAVTVSAVPDEQSGEVGGLQNTVTNLGASLGTALAGAILISSLTASFISGIEENPDVPDDVVEQAEVELAGGLPFVSNDDLEAALERADVPPSAAEVIIEENESARIRGLQSSLSILALVTLLALFFTRPIPSAPVGAPTAAGASDTRDG
jgi:hypothetical protein